MKHPYALAVASLALLLTACSPRVGDSGQPPSVGGAEPQTEETAAPVEPESEFTLGQEQAMRKAESYLATLAFSRQGLIDQLVFEGFSLEDSTFAVDNITVDWNAQAAAKAESYLETMSFSRQGLIDQLVFEGFTLEQAEYGVTAVGY